MGDKNKNKIKNKNKSTIDIEECDTCAEMEVEASPSDNRSRRRSRSLDLFREAAEGPVGSITKRKKNMVESNSSDDDEPLTGAPAFSALELLRQERIGLEAYLFNENNRVNKNAIKIILEKWAKMEVILQNEIIDHEKLKVAHQGCGVAPALVSVPMSYARVAAGPTLASAATMMVPEKERNLVRNKKNEVILIKPISETEKRGNEEIKKDMTAHLREIETKLKIVSVRQMRNPGLVIELDGAKDVTAIENSELQKIGLKIERPRRTQPSTIIYDVEKDYGKEELAVDIVEKNFDVFSDEERKDLKDRIVFRTCFNSRDNRVNWVVQMPGKYARELHKQDRIFMRWRTYKIREYTNVVRCFECNAYGHIARVCTVQDPLCGYCGREGHIATDCRAEYERCSNCIRTKRREVNHPTTSKDCPEYIRQVQIHRNRIEWD